MPPKPKRPFKSSIEAGKRVISSTGRICEGFGESPETVKKEQAKSLMRLYRRQRGAVLSVFCLSRGRIRSNSQRRNGSTFGVDEDILEPIEIRALLNTSELTRELDVSTEEDLIEKLRELLSAVYRNCKKIAKQSNIEFEADKPDEPNISIKTEQAHRKQGYRRITMDN